MLFFELDFLLLFLPALIVAGVAMRSTIRRQQFAWIGVVASLVFLGVSGYASVATAVASLATNYFGARWLLKHRTRARYLSLVFVNVAILGYFKYSIFLTDNFLPSLKGSGWHYALPLGISFYTFQQIAFLTDIYKHRITEFRFRTYALFILFFPQFIAGPIVHLNRVKAAYERWPTFNPRSIRFALVLFAIGMAKKLIGDYFGVHADHYFSDPTRLDCVGAWLGALCFTFQIYFDFSAYCDMAIGLARLFGVNLPINFNSPYKAVSLSDFWRRWHITLSQWLRDHLYIPMGGNRFGPGRTFLALAVTMLLGGLWHGAAWHFVVWGAIHGVGLIVARVVRISLPRAVGRVLVFLFVTLAWIFFRAENLGDANAQLMAALGMGDLYTVPTDPWTWTAVTAASVMCLCLPNSQTIALRSAARRVSNYRLIEIPLLTAAIVLLAAAMINPETSNAFIYFEF